MASIKGESEDSSVPGVRGENTAGGRGVEGFSESAQGIYGESKDETGVAGISQSFVGVSGESKGPHSGVYGKSTEGKGVSGESVAQVGVFGMSEKFVGIWGESKGPHSGVYGKSTEGRGVSGESVNQVGVLGISEKFVGIWAEAKTPDHPALIAKGMQKAALFEGDVEVTGDIRLTNADFAEDFDVLEHSEPGDVMVLTENGGLKQSTIAYDKKVVGIISGAGDYKPAIILDKQDNSEKRKPIAMMGKAYCKVDASYAPIEIGDLLTTAPTIGHAMKVADPLKAFGAVIGKALRPLKEGQGLIPILIALQ